MARVRIDLNEIRKPMKPLHGGGQPPLGGKGMTEYFHYLCEAGIPFSRLHDVGGAFGGGRFVDIPNVFRNFDADEKDPASYDFTFTDHLIKALIEVGVEPYYRLGTTIENQALIKAYHTHPPKDYGKWARICEHIIRHYTEGWADGFHYPIRYWEIWNEPDVQRQMMWSGTDEEFYRLYDVAAKHLKACFPHLKIGGYASCGFYAIAPRIKVDPETLMPGTIPPSEHEERLMRFFHGFFAYIKEHASPIDFFSWHSYADTARVKVMDEWLHGELERLGYAGLETHLNEWNPVFQEFGTAHHSAEIAAMMIALQHGHTDLACIYDMRTNTAPYCPLFDIRTHTPIHGYYSMLAFDALYRLGNQVLTESDTESLYALAASDGTRHALLLSNLTERDHPLSIDGAEFSHARCCAIDGAEFSHARCRVIDDAHMLSEIPLPQRIHAHQVLLVEWE